MTPGLRRLPNFFTLYLPTLYLPGLTSLAFLTRLQAAGAGDAAAGVAGTPLSNAATSAAQSIFRTASPPDRFYRLPAGQATATPACGGCPSCGAGVHAGRAVRVPLTPASGASQTGYIRVPQLPQNVLPATQGTPQILQKSCGAVEPTAAARGAATGAWPLSRRTSPATSTASSSPSAAA